MTQHMVRFAPSPTGDLHLGHLYSALYSWQAAGKQANRFHLRIDDLDYTRCRTIFIERQIADLHWAGISWTHAPVYQSQRLARYQDALTFLKDEGLVYPCFLSRAEVNAILSAPQEATSLRGALSDEDMTDRQAAGTEPAWRLDMVKIAANTPILTWHDRKKGRQQVDCHSLSDAIIARRDIGASYDLSVVLDDYDSGVTLVTRGADLLRQTDLHCLLHHLLSMTMPDYDHHRLVTDESGNRLAKRDDARSLASYRERGATFDDVMALLADYPTYDRG